MESQIIEKALEVSAATLENLDKLLEVSTPSPRTATSPRISEWKLVSKKISGAALSLDQQGIKELHILVLAL